MRHVLPLPVGILALLVSVSSLTAAKRDTPEKPTPVPLFEAVAAKQVEVGVIPRDSTRMTVQIKNIGNQPLTIQLPPAFAAVPVLAQQPGPFNFPPLANQPQNNLPQAVGAGNNQQRQFPFFNVPPGKTVKVRVPCVCLEHGKPDPRPLHPYELKPLDSVTTKPEVAGLLSLLAREAYSQKLIQLAIWHVENDMSWEELAGQLYTRANGTTRPLYTPAELAHAKAIYAHVESPSSPAQPRASLSQR